MIEHIPWPDERPTLGLNGRRIALVGYSHWRKQDEADTDEFTRDVIQTVLEDKCRRALQLLRVLPTYFGYGPTDPAFWNHVTFFNYLPECVGVTEEKFRHGSPSQIERAKARFLRILSNIHADKVLIFTSRSWALPQTLEQKSGHENIPLGVEFPDFWRGSYEVSEGRIVHAFKLRHPMTAPSKLMQDAIRLIMSDARPS